jgi:hypothetical protein
MNGRYVKCEICGSLGHTKKSCALFRLEELKQAKNPTRTIFGGSRGGGKAELTRILVASAKSR